MTEQLTLVHTEQKMRELVTELARAQRMLADARDDEVEAKHVWEAKRRRTLLSPDCPRTGRGVESVTTAVRDAWVDLRCEGEEHVYNIAVVKREAAADHLRTLRDQSMLVMSLSRSVQISMGLAGQAQPEWSR
jgi:hypothetical protein